MKKWLYTYIDFQNESYPYRAEEIVLIDFSLITDNEFILKVGEHIDFLDSLRNMNAGDKHWKGKQEAKKALTEEDWSLVLDEEEFETTCCAYKSFSWSKQGYASNPIFVLLLGEGIVAIAKNTKDIVDELTTGREPIVDDEVLLEKKMKEAYEKFLNQMSIKKAVGPETFKTITEL